VSVADAAARDTDVVAMLALTGQLRFRYPPRSELAAQQLGQLYARAALARAKAKLSPRRFAKLSRSELAEFAALFGLSRADARLAQTMIEAAWAMRRLSSLSHHLARTSERRLQ
jgi:hypothetical protein